MVQGTGSEVGKSVITAGLCRVLMRRGFTVRPFKPQNMSNNAAVTLDGGEIGRAQALQARACGVPPSFHMNPVLLKPQTEIGAQLVVQGHVIGNFEARDYTSIKPTLLEPVLESFSLLSDQADVVVVEGAGSPAEINLRDGDIANMGFAEASNTPVILIADIERGGVIANLVGTYEVLSDTERKRVVGFIINKFRGDKSLFDKGAIEIENRTGWSCLGVVPYFKEAGKLPAEDAVRLQKPARTAAGHVVKIAVPVFSRIANFDDLDPFCVEPGVSVQFVSPGDALPGDADLIVLPGSKSTRSDLELVYKERWDVDIDAHVRRGGWVIGLCGGYQMLGKKIVDPDGVEGPAGTSKGLGYLDVETVIAGDKTLLPAEGTTADGNHIISGYEMHMGQTNGPGTSHPMLLALPGEQLDGGSICSLGRVMGCYLHGLFNNDTYRSYLLSQITGQDRGNVNFENVVETTLDGLAEHLEKHLDIPAIADLASLDINETV